MKSGIGHRHLCCMKDHPPQIHLYRIRLLGLLFLLVMPFYGLGHYWLQGHWQQGLPIPDWQWLPGVIFQVANALSVVAMAFLVRPLVYPWQKSIGRIYLVARVLEAVLLLAGLAIFWNTNSTISSVDGLKSLHYQEGFYHAAMMTLGLGSIPMLWALKANGSLPSWLVYWGWIGYALLVTGAAFNWVQQINVLEWSYVGGLFEIFLGAWLIIHGFLKQTNPVYLPASLRRMRLRDSG